MKPSPNYANDSQTVSPLSLKLMELKVERHAQGLLDALLIDTASDHNTRGTAKRMAKMFVREVCRGRYTAEPAFTVFPNTRGLDEIVMTGPLQVRSLCSHHFCPILGQAWIGVLPGGYLAGLSKFSRVLDWYASRPQMQEELTLQVADYLEHKLHPKGVAIVIKASHTCMTWRGVREQPSALMTTSVMRGVFRTSAEARAEFLSLL